MEKRTDGIKRTGTELPFNLQVENLSVQIGDSHNTSYYNDNSCGGCDCGCPEPLPSWDEYSDFFAADDDGFMIDMDKMAEKIHKDTGVDLDVVKTVLLAESEIMDDLGIMDIVMNGDDVEDEDEPDEDEPDEDEAPGEECDLFSGMSEEEAREATECLLKAIFPELKDKKFTFAVGSVSKGNGCKGSTGKAENKEGAHGKK